MFIKQFYYIRALFLRQRDFENMRFNYDVILNVMDIAFSQIKYLTVKCIMSSLHWHKNDLNVPRNKISVTI